MLCKLPLQVWSNLSESKRSERTLRGATWCRAVGVIISVIGANAALSGEPGTVPLKDIESGRVKIIGNLGQPIRQVITIRGEWRKPDVAEKLSDLYFDVTRVDAENYTPPIVLRQNDVQPVHSAGTSSPKDRQNWDWKASWGAKESPPRFHPGEEWELVGMQVLTTRIRVAEWEERGPIVAEPGGSNFDTHFKFFRARRLFAKDGSLQQGQRPPKPD